MDLALKIFVIWLLLCVFFSFLLVAIYNMAKSHYINKRRRWRQREWLDEFS